MNPSLMLFAFLAAVTVTAAAETPSTMPARRNVILIVSDDLTDTLGCYGNKVVKTPQIDRLASRGMVFRNSFCQLAICNPSRASMMSGLTPESCGVLGQGQNYQPKKSDPPFLHRLFQSNGYETIHAGKIFHGTHTEEMKKVNPDRVNLATDDPGGWTKSFDRKPVPESQKPQYRKQHADGELGEYREWHAIDADGKEHADVTTAREAVQSISAAVSANKPFFLAVGLHKPHLPWFVPQKYFDMYKLEDMPIPKEPAGHAESIPQYARNNSTNDPPKDEKEFRECVRAYYACVSFCDDQVGTILAEVDRQKLWDSTTIVLVGDNGFHLGEHGLWGKRTLFEESAAVPIIVAGTGISKPGQVCMRTVEVLDIYPTLAELCALPVHSKLMGKSLVPLLNDPATAWDRPAYTIVERESMIGRSVRSERYRYTEWDDGKVGVELYDHESDPNEYHNIAADPKMADVVKTLKSQIELRKTPVRQLKAGLKTKVSRLTGLRGKKLWLLAYGSGGGAVLIVALIGFWWWRRRRRAQQAALQRAAT